MEPATVADEISGGAETIMLVDDKPMVLEIGGYMLKELGYTVLEAKGGKEIIAIFRKNKDSISLIILDMIMPYMHGGEVFDALKQINPVFV